MKRFYKDVTVQPAETGDGFCIHLDGRPVKLAETRQTLCVPMQGLAQAIAEEWDAQTDSIQPDTMPLMQIISTQLEKVTRQRATMQAQILTYVDTDLLFYRTDKPPELAALQAQHWDPALQAFSALYKLPPLLTTTDLIALKQPQALHKAVQTYSAALSDAAFTVFQIAVPLSGSVIVGMLFTQGALSPEQVLEIARVEERHKDALYNAEKYGADPSIEKADAAMLRDLKACRTFLALI